MGRTRRRITTKVVRERISRFKCLEIIVIEIVLRIGHGRCCGCSRVVHCFANKAPVTRIM
jgi:hypothetical protein